MAWNYFLINPATNEKKVGSVAGSSGAPVPQIFDVGAGGQTTFVITQTFTAGSLINVWINGRKAREGASYDFTRNTGTNSIIFNSTVPQYAVVETQVYA